MNAPLLSLRHGQRLFIGGEWVEPSGSGRIKIRSAHSGEPFTEVAEADASDVERAVAAARDAFDNGPWPRMSHGERAGYLNAIAAGLAARADELGHAWTNQMGVLHSMAAYNGPINAGVFQYYAGLAASFPFVERHEPSLGGGTGYLVQEAVGVVAAIIPWNAPLTMLAYKLAPALLAGCTVIAKASPEAPAEALILAEIAEAAGLPPGVLNVVTADRDVSELLVRHHDVDKVSFTGSSAAGRRIAAICGDRIARCTLELGGKSAAVVLDDYDMATAAEALSQSILFMSGQVCATLSRVIVPRRRQADLVDAMAAMFRAVKVGDPYDQASQLGPLATERQRDRVEGYIAKGKAEGATLAAGGGRPAHTNRGWYVEPTVFADVERDATIAQEEIFGPVVSVIAAEDEDDAVAIANGTVFGLNSAVFTNDLDAAYRVGRRMRAGTVGHNGFRTDFNIGFGGFKQSGLGREGGVAGLRAYLEPKTMLMGGDLPGAG